LLVLRNIVQIEALAQDAEVGVHCIDTQGDLGGDLLVGGRGSETFLLLQGPAQRHQDAASRGRELAHNRQLPSTDGRDGSCLGGMAERQARSPKPECVPVYETLTTGNAAAV